MKRQTPFFLCRDYKEKYQVNEIAVEENITGLYWCSVSLGAEKSIGNKLKDCLCLASKRSYGNAFLFVVKSLGSQESKSCCIELSV